MSNNANNHLSQAKRSAAAELLRREILAKVAEYYQVAHQAAPFVPGETLVNYGGRVYDEKELQSGVSSILEFWLTEGPRVADFSKKLGDFVGLKHILTVNSGSSANLVAISTLCSPRMEHPLQPGDEVITPAATFPTTVAPIVQNQLVPVFVDCEIGTYNLNANLLPQALSDKTRAIFVPHILGNPVEMDKVMAFAQAHNLYVIEDTCDALGSQYDGRYCGAFGHLSTYSFYPAHHITTGEGGAVGTNDPQLYRLAHAVRDWGRDCWCSYDSPHAGACGQRFDWIIPGLDEPYDHRYYFTEIGYNLKMTDVQAAIGLPQLDKLPRFIAARQRNFQVLYAGLKPYQDFLVLPVWKPKADPAWFAFTLTVREHAPFTRRDLNDYLHAHKVQTRYLFAGNILHQPGYRNIPHRVATSLAETDRVLKSALFIGVYPGMSEAHLDYMLEVFEGFFKTYR